MVPYDFCEMSFERGDIYVCLSGHMKQVDVYELQ